MTVPVLDALARLDDGAPLPGDRATADRYDTHLQVCAFVEPLWCPHGVNVAADDCDQCYLDHDQAMRRAEDQ